MNDNNDDEQTAYDYVITTTQTAIKILLEGRVRYFWVRFVQSRIVVGRHDTIRLFISSDCNPTSNLGLKNL